MKCFSILRCKGLLECFCCPLFAMVVLMVILLICFNYAISVTSRLSSEAFHLPASVVGSGKLHNVTEIIMKQLQRPKAEAASGTINIHVAKGVSAREGVEEFTRCMVRNCLINRNESLREISQAVVLVPESEVNFNRSSNQVWVMSLLESPVNTESLSAFNDKVNYTASYSLRSDLPTPYGWIRKSKAEIKLPKKNYAQGKYGTVLSIISNCMTANSRKYYIQLLDRYVKVDVYGKCGFGWINAKRAKALMQHHYKFFLAFENANCKDYVTEKFFNALSNNIVPIVYGESRAFYESIAPPHSFIHLNDYPDIKTLGQKLAYLERNDTAYNEYFAWKRHYYLTDTQFFCRLCNLLQKPIPKVYPQLDEWWQGNGDCLVDL